MVAVSTRARVKYPGGLASRAVCSTDTVDLLLHYASLAQSFHNAQPWRFRLRERAILVEPDMTRRAPAADPDGHHLYASLGCAVENLVVAARAIGLRGDCVFHDGARVTASVSLEPAGSIASSRTIATRRSRAISRRQVVRVPFGPNPVPGDLVAALCRDAAGDGVCLHLVDDAKGREDIRTLTLEAAHRLFGDARYRAEIKHWTRFDLHTAQTRGDGLFVECSGGRAMPAWFGRLMFDTALMQRREHDRLDAVVDSSSGFIVITTEQNHPAGWIRVGRACQRFALDATAAGVQYGFLNQAVQVPATRVALAKRFGIDQRRVSLVLRYGYVDPQPRSFRRSTNDVMIDERTDARTDRAPDRSTATF